MHITSRFALGASLISTVLVGCSGDQITDVPLVSSSPASSAQLASVERPWSGECDVVAVFTSATDLLITGTCNLAHLGKTTLVASQTIDPSSFPIAYTNTSTYTAANGDELRTTDIGTATPGPSGLILSGAVTVVGGSGRFANASGSAALDGAVAFTGPGSTVGAYDLSGRISY